MDDFYKRREECTKAAMESGITNALKSLVVAVPIVAFLSTRSHFVKHSVSTKTALIVSPFFFSFFLSLLPPLFARPFAVLPPIFHLVIIL